jgi:hypothetical protein
VEEIMLYILLAAGIILLIFGLTGLNGSGMLKYHDNENLKTKNVEFENILSSSIILERLNVIENKLDLLGSSISKPRSYDIENIIEKYGNTQLNINAENISDINMQIFSMKDNGMSVEKIADRLGIKKGEVLLRLGMRK